MIKIELDPYEQKDLIEFLKYAINQKELNRPEPNHYLRGGGAKFDTTDYDINRMEYLIEQIKHPYSKTNVFKPVSHTQYLTRESKQNVKYEQQKSKKENSEGLVELL